MPNRLNILFLEANDDDRFMVDCALVKAGIEFDSTWVSTRRDFVWALESGRPDVILADCDLTDVDAPGALEIVARLRPGTPVIVVTGELSDECAAELLHAGAADYLLKDRLARLGHAVLATLERVRAQATRCEDAVRLKQALRIAA